MKNYSLLEERNLTLEDNVEVNLKYYLVDRKKESKDCGCTYGEEESFDEGEVVYGIKLVKEDSKMENVTIEEDEVSGITLSEKVARDLLETLANNTVTPMVLGEVVDEWICTHDA